MSRLFKTAKITKKQLNVEVNILRSQFPTCLFQVKKSSYRGWNLEVTIPEDEWVACLKQGLLDQLSILTHVYRNIGWTLGAILDIEKEDIS